MRACKWPLCPEMEDLKRFTGPSRAGAADLPCQQPAQHTSITSQAGLLPALTVQESLHVALASHQDLR